MAKLSEIAAGGSGKVISVGGSPEFQRRITAVGIIPGGNFSVVKNEKRFPVLLNVRSTILAVNRGDCEHILVEVSNHG